MEIAGQRKGLLIVAGTLSALSSACMLVPYWAVYEVLRLLLTGNAASGEMVHWGWVAFGGLVAGLVLLYLALMASHVAAFNVLYGLRIRITEHIGRLSLGYLNGTTTGAIKKTMEQNVEKIETFIAHTIPDLVGIVATVAVTLAIFLSLNAWLALAVLLVVLALWLQFSVFMGEKTKEFVRLYYDAQEQMSGSAVQYVRGMHVVKIFGQSVASFRQFGREIEAYKTYALGVCDTYERGYCLFNVALQSVVTMVLPVGILLWQGDVAFAAVWLFFIVMGPGVASPVFKQMFLGSSTREIDEGVSRIDRILERQPIAEATEPKTPKNYDIEFRHVSFAYENGRSSESHTSLLGDGRVVTDEGEANTDTASRTEALKDITFTAHQGEITALVGPSGSGKSTVANLIPRFWDVSSGEILIGGVNIKDIATDRLMNLVSFVFQDSFLFYDTIYENIAVGQKSATKDDVERAARAAQCHDFIMSLPNGYDTRIGDWGVYLSGGEAQRICVARAILKNAPILVLDEATAFADPENEYKMQQALAELMKSKTVIVIAHRMQSIISANQIIVLRDGRIEQQGQHITLSTTEGLYKDMWKAYTSAFNWQLNN